MRKTRSSGMSDKEIREGLRDGLIRVTDGMISFHYDHHHGGFARVKLSDSHCLTAVSRRERRLILKSANSK